jgi:hypothetical protein
LTVAVTILAYDERLRAERPLRTPPSHVMSPVALFILGGCLLALSFTTLFCLLVG